MHAGRHLRRWGLLSTLLWAAACSSSYGSEHEPIDPEVALYYCGGECHELGQPGAAGRGGADCELERQPATLPASLQRAADQPRDGLQKRPLLIVGRAKEVQIGSRGRSFGRFT